MHLPHRTHLSICLSTYTKRKRAHSRPMAVMRASGQRLCQMVHDAGLRHGAEDRLQTVLETGWWMAAVDANYDSQLDQMIVATTNKFTVLKKLTDDIAVLLQPARPGSSLPAPKSASMAGTSFKHWWPCDCPPTPRRMSTWRSRSPCKNSSTYTSTCTSKSCT
jgi:hypothetical protein